MIDIQSSTPSINFFVMSPHLIKCLCCVLDFFFSVTSQSFSTINRFLIYWCKASDPEANLGYTETILERRQEGRADEREEEQKRERTKKMADFQELITNINEEIP